MAHDPPSSLAARKTPIHQPVVELSNRPIIVFVTVCTAERKRILADRSATGTIVGAWSRADSWKVGRYVIMPDHIHLFCSPGTRAVTLGRWVSFWKSCASRSWPRSEDRPIWQADYWDTQLRFGESYETKWEYVRSNPVRHGFANHPDDWPYQGELTVLRWD